MPVQRLHAHRMCIFEDEIKPPSANLQSGQIIHT